MCAVDCKMRLRGKRLVIIISIHEASRIVMVCGLLMAWELGSAPLVTGKQQSTSRDKSVALGCASSRGPYCRTYWPLMSHDMPFPPVPRSCTPTITLVAAAGAPSARPTAPSITALMPRLDCRCSTRGAHWPPPPPPPNGIVQPAAPPPPPPSSCLAPSVGCW